MVDRRELLTNILLDSVNGLLDTEEPRISTKLRDIEIFFRSLGSLLLVQRVCSDIIILVGSFSKLIQQID